MVIATWEMSGMGIYQQGEKMKVGLCTSILFSFPVGFLFADGGYLTPL
jgi:hypothetical protein